MISFPNAKINLGLNIVEKREDGFHNLETCFYPIPLFDSLEIIPSKEFKFQSFGRKIPGKEEFNLCIKAFRLLQEDFNIPNVEILLVKNIPMGGGLGGGSSNGAFTLKMLNQLFDLNLDRETLEKYALTLGSDCPFFIENKTSLAFGRGEIFKKTTLNLSGYTLAIANPNIHVSTKNAFDGIKAQFPAKSIKEIISHPPPEWKNDLVNDFEMTVLKQYPEIEAIKKEMYQKGAIYASMTGTGSTVYGIFDNQIDDLGWSTFKLR